MRGIDFLVKEFTPGECYSLSNVRFSRTREGEAPVERTEPLGASIA